MLQLKIKLEIEPALHLSLEPEIMLQLKIWNLQEGAGTIRRVKF